MSNYIKLVQNQAELTAFKASNDFVTPNVTLVYDNDSIDYNPIPHDYSRDYLTFITQESGTFKFSGNSIDYSVDDGETWITLASNTDSPTIQAGDKIIWKAELTPTSSNGIGTFSSTGSFTSQGNVMSLLYGDNFGGQTSLSGKNYAFNNLFRNCADLISAENMSLPATTLASYCYLAMFGGCTSLTTTPELPATTLASNCYSYMFSNCTSLTTAPVLPATTLAGSCYYYMFQGCTSLTTTPILPAATLTEYCYSCMFAGCTNLNNITCLATNISASGCTDVWVYGVAATGTFIKAASMTSWTTGTSGIPSGWVSVDFVEDGLILNSNSVSITYGQQYVLPTLFNLNNLPLTYSSSNTNVATVNNNGEITLTGYGTTTISIIFNGNNDYEARTLTYILTYQKANINPSVSISDWAYGDTASNPSVSGNIENGTVTYTYSSDNLTWSSAQPTNAGTYYIKAIIAATSNYNGAECTNTFIIAKANINPSVSISDWAYGDTASNPSVSGNSGGGSITYTYSSDNSTWSSTQPTNVGTYYIKATIASTSNYNGAECTNTFIISKANINPTVSISNWTYGETASNPSVSGNIENGTVTYTYSDDNLTWSSTQPTNAGTYYIKATITSTSNYNGAECINTFTIAKANINPSVSISNWTYGETASNPSVSGNIENGTVTYTYSDDNTNWSSTQPTNAGTYYIKATISATSNYNGAECISTFKIFGFADKYLTFIAQESGTFAFTNPINYSIDDGETWTSLSASTNTPTINAGDKILWKAELTPTSSNGIGTFSSTGEFNSEGNPISLLYGDNFIGQIDLTGKNYTFYYLFKNCTKLIDAENLSLLATTLASSCYRSMFDGCTSLTTTPVLPATTLASYCYQDMFQGCTSLITAPELPATTLASYCYANMFKNCTSLTIAPELPATTLTTRGYDSMFSGCSALTTAPELPATTLSSMCYEYMFLNCSGLTTAPELPATTLTYECYYYMFAGCTSLTIAPELPATTLAHYCYGFMFKGCTSLTTAPEELPATTLANYCYSCMFQDCTSLTTASELPATTLANYCYADMFQGCTSLTTAPEELPATALAEGCYTEMFKGCSTLTTAPKLPATRVSSYGYPLMFYGCTSLNSITMLATNISATGCLSNWVSGVSSSGTFTKASSMTSLPSGASGIPSGWTVQDYVAS